MVRAVILPYKMGSKSAKALSEALGLKRIRHNGRYVHRRGNIILNWGCGALPDNIPNNDAIVNNTRKVEIAGNKLLAFRAMDGFCTIPEFTTDKAKVREWQITGDKVVVRKQLRGSGGAGIELLEPNDDIPNAPLYTRYVKKKDEYRVHVVNGQVIDFAKKMVRAGSEGNNFQVRNFDNGWIFARGGAELPHDVKEQSLKAIEALSLDFGAVDVGYNIREDVATVYEVNTAPGLEGTTITSYANTFRRLMHL